LKTSCNGDCGAHREVEVRKLVSGDVRSGIDRGTSFVHQDDHRALRAKGVECIADQSIGLAAGGSIADRNQLHTMLLYEAEDLGARAILLMEIDQAGIEKSSCAAHHGELTTGAEARIHPQGDPAPRWRREQEPLQVLPE